MWINLWKLESCFSVSLELKSIHLFFPEAVETFEYFLPLKSPLMSFYSQKITSCLCYSTLNDTILIKTTFKNWNIFPKSNKPLESREQMCSKAPQQKRSHLGLPSGALLHHGAWHGAADGEALEKPSNWVTQTQGNEFLPEKKDSIYKYMIAA